MSGTTGRIAHDEATRVEATAPGRDRRQLARSSTPDSASRPGPLEALTSAWLARRVRRVAASAVVVGAAAARARLDAALAAHPGRKLVAFYWIEDVLPMMVADAAVHGVFGPGIEEIRFVCDDSLGGRVAESLLARLGRRTLLLRWRHPGNRVRDLQRILRSAEPMGIAVDGHGPYGRVGEAFPRLVESAHAVAVPVAVVADRSSRVWAKAMLAVPRPGARLAIAVGEALDAESAVPGASPFEVALARARADCAAVLEGRA